MKKLLVDTNIVIDLLAKREPFYIEAAELFSLADKKQVYLYVNSLTFANTYYILNKNTDAKTARSVLRKFKTLIIVLNIDDKIIELSLNDNNFNDFEDAIQYYSALENNLDIILTRNLKDYKKSQLPVMTARHFINSIQE